MVILYNLITKDLTFNDKCKVGIQDFPTILLIHKKSYVLSYVKNMVVSLRLVIGWRKSIPYCIDGH